MSCKLVIIDDHPIFRDGLRLLLEKHQDLHIAAEAASFPEAYELLERERPDVILLDVRLSNGTDGVAVARELRRRDPQAKILMLTMVDEPERAAEAFAAGALGYATKDESSEQVAAAIRKVAAGQRYLSPVLPHAEVEAARAEQSPADLLQALTPRERQIFEMLLLGETSGEIGARLYISPRTVETHRARILGKLGARSTLDLVRLGAKLGLLGNNERRTG